MIWLPSIIHLHIIEKSKRRIRLWIPVFLLWPLMIVIIVGLAPVMLIAAVVTWQKGYSKMLLLLGPLIFITFCRLRGLKVYVKGKDEQVQIAIW